MLTESGCGVSAAAADAEAPTEGDARVGGGGSCPASEGGAAQQRTGERCGKGVWGAGEDRKTLQEVEGSGGEEEGKAGGK